MLSVYEHYRREELFEAILHEKEEERTCEKMTQQEKRIDGSCKAGGTLTKSVMSPPARPN